MLETETDLPAFLDTVEHAMQIATEAADDWEQVHVLNSLRDSVYLKNSEGIMVYANDAFRESFSPIESPIGRSAQSFLDETISGVSRASDYMVLNTSNYVDFDHAGRTAQGQLRMMRTNKRSLAPLGNPGLALIGVCRCGDPIDEPGNDQRLILVDQNLRFRSMDEVDREICKRIGQGMKVREIGEELRLTPRAIEQRKKKILDTLQLSGSTDLIKLLVRLQDNGYVDLGL